MLSPLISQQRTISQSHCDAQQKVDCTQWPVTTTSVAGPRSFKVDCIQWPVTTASVAGPRSFKVDCIQWPVTTASVAGPRSFKVDCTQWPVTTASVAGPRSFKVDCTQWPVTTASVAGPRSFKALPKAEFSPKNGHGHCLVVCCLSDPRQLSESWGKHCIWEVHSKSMRYPENPNTCSWHWVATTTPNLTSHNQGFKSWMNSATKFCLIRPIHLTSCQLTAISSDIFTALGRENTSTTSRMQKMPFKSLSDPEAWICMLQG